MSSRKCNNVSIVTTACATMFEPAIFVHRESEPHRLVTVMQEMVAKKIMAMKDNKSPGVDGIPPKLLMETVEQTSIPLARVFILSLKEGVVPFE